MKNTTNIVYKYKHKL